MAESADWAGTDGSGLTWLSDPRTWHAEHPGAIKMILLHGCPLVSPPPCPEWLLVRRHMGPNPPKVD